MPISVRFAPRLLLAVSLVPSLVVASMAGCQGEATGVLKTTPAAPIPTVAATAEPTTPTMGDAAAPAPAAKPAAPKTAPTPFTAEQIRAATPPPSRGGGPPAPPPAPAPPPPRPAPPPSPAEQIRAAPPAGRVYVFLVKDGDGPQHRRRIEFVAPNESSVTMRVTNQDLFGRDQGAPQDETVTWDELVSHARYPLDQVTISEERVTVRAGSYDAKLYTVKGPDGVTRAWFAKSLPGAPVKHLVERDGKPVSSMELFQHEGGG